MEEHKSWDFLFSIFLKRFRCVVIPHYLIRFNIIPLVSSVNWVRKNCICCHSFVVILKIHVWVNSPECHSYWFSVTTVNRKHVIAFSWYTCRTRLWNVVGVLHVNCVNFFFHIFYAGSTCDIFNIVISVYLCPRNFFIVEVSKRCIKIFLKFRKTFENLNVTSNHYKIWIFFVYYILNVLRCFFNIAVQIWEYNNFKFTFVVKLHSNFAFKSFLSIVFIFINHPEETRG